MRLIVKATNRYKPLSGYKTVKLISDILKNNAPLSKEQKRYLRESFGNIGFYGNLGMDFQIYSWEGKDNKSTIWWRLTLPLLISITLLSIPFLFIITGNTYFPSKSKFSGVLNAWYGKIYRY